MPRITSVSLPSGPIGSWADKYFGQFEAPWMAPHPYVFPKGANSFDRPCEHCGRYFLSMTEGVGRYIQSKQFLHTNIKMINLSTRPGEPVSYDIEVYDPEPDVDYPTPNTRSKQRVMAFNQFSQLLQRARQDHNLLDQNEVWVNRDGIKVLLTNMSARYATNVLSWLRKAAKEYHSSWATWEFVTKYSDQSATDFEELLDQTITDAKAREWIKETKMYKALTEIAKHSV